MKLLLLFIYLQIVTLPTSDVKYVHAATTKYEMSYSMLKVEDFIVARFKDTSALVSTSISYEYKSVGDKVTVNAYCKVNKQRSFFNKSFLNKIAERDYILNHEQRHFDITYIYTQKLVERLRRYPSLTADEVRGAYNKIIIEPNAFQYHYDSETQKAHDEHQQGVWDIKINKYLYESASRPI